MGQIYRDDWIIQSELLIKNVEVGSLVKISNGVERFYVEIIDIKMDEFIGKVCNMLMYKKDYNLGDLVIFSRYNLMEIYTPYEKQIKFLNASKNEMVQKNIKEYIEKFEKEHNRLPVNNEIYEYFEKTLNTRVFKIFM